MQVDPKMKGRLSPVYPAFGRSSLLRYTSPINTISMWKNHGKERTVGGLPPSLI
jgi:hypothetical protein